MCIVTEIVVMKTAGYIPRDEFITIVDGLENNFHSKQSGFIDTELLYNDKTDEWMIIQHWASMDELKAASKRMFQDAAAEPFVKSLNPESVNMTILPQLKQWK